VNLIKQKIFKTTKEEEERRRGPAGGAPGCSVRKDSINPLLWRTEKVDLGRDGGSSLGELDKEKKTSRWEFGSYMH